MSHSSQVNWGQAEFQDYWLNLYLLTSDNVYNHIRFWGPIRIDGKVYVDISVSTIEDTPIFVSWRVESKTLGQILIDIWGPQFDLKRLGDVTSIDLEVLSFWEESQVGNKARLKGEEAKSIGKRILKTAKTESGFGNCGYNIEVTFTFSDGSTVLGWLNGDSCPGISFDNGPNIMFHKEITEKFYKLLKYGDDFISE